MSTGLLLLSLCVATVIQLTSSGLCGVSSCGGTQQVLDQLTTAVSQLQTAVSQLQKGQAAVNATCNQLTEVKRALVEFIS